jgi:hypothetical protein
MTVSEKIKTRIKTLRVQIDYLDDTQHGYDDFNHGFDRGKASAKENELDFLVEILDEIERKALKEQGYNV